MTLIPWKNKRGDLAASQRVVASPLEQFRSELDRMFDRFFRSPWFGDEDFLAPTANWTPSLDVAESDQEVTIRAELPGMDPKDLDISVSGDVLTLAGEKKESTERKGENFYHAERRFGSFRRTIPLPSTVDAEKVNAEYADGVLTVRLAKQAGAAPKRIPVKSVKG